MNPSPIIDFVIRMEGGFVSDPADPGGATNHGISLRFLKSLDPALGDLDQDGDVDLDDVRAMTPSRARALYTLKFYTPMEIWKYPPALGAVLLDTAVNMGRKKSVLLLQRGLNGAGYSLVEDGIAGPRTMAMVRGMDPQAMVRFVLLERVLEYVRLCLERPQLRRFLFGWLNRCAELIRFTETLP
jgi:lysozyme family protein